MRNHMSVNFGATGTITLRIRPRMQVYWSHLIQSINTIPIPCELSEFKYTVYTQRIALSNRTGGGNVGETPTMYVYTESISRGRMKIGSSYTVSIIVFHRNPHCPHY